MTDIQWSLKGKDLEEDGERILYSGFTYFQFSTGHDTLAYLFIRQNYIVYLLH